jgi:hypothetical protein
MGFARRCLCLLERNEDVLARLVAHNSSDVTAAGGILGEHHVARTKSADCAVADFNFCLSGKRDHVLTLRRGMKVARVRGRRGTKNNTLAWMQCRSLHLTFEMEFDLDVFEMGFVVRSSVKPDNLHEACCRRIAREKQGKRLRCMVHIIVHCYSEDCHPEWNKRC